MTPYELLDLALSLSNRIDTHWTLFITVHLALIGGIIYVDRPLLRNEKIAAMLIYSGFAVVNFLMMMSQAKFLGTIYQQIFEMKDLACCQNSPVTNYIASLHERDSTSISVISIAVAHISMYLILALSVLFDKAKIKKSGLVKEKNKESTNNES